MTETTKHVSHSFPIVGLLGLLFITLKLTGQINWSWWWVLLPFWGLPAVLLAIIGVCGLVWVFRKLAIWFVEWRAERERRAGRR